MSSRRIRRTDVAFAVALALGLTGCDMVKDYLSDGGGNLVRTVRQKGEGMVEDARREALAAADEPWDQAEEELGDALNDASNNLEEQAGDMLDDATGAAGEDGPRRRAAADSDQDPFAF